MRHNRDPFGRGFCEPGAFFALIRAAGEGRGGRGPRGPFPGFEDGRERGWRGRHGGPGMGAGGMGIGPDMGPGFEGGPGMKRRRLFDQDELQVLLLSLIVEAPRHGYDLIRAIESISGGEYAPSPGVVYPALTYMEEAGIVARIAREEGPRKVYQATEEGLRRDEAEADKVAGLRQRLEAIAEARRQVDPAPVRRAMHALKSAVFDRLRRHGGDRALVLAIADAIDEATRKIERIEP